MKYYKCLDGTNFGFDEGKIYPEDYLGAMHIKDGVAHWPIKFKEVSKQEYLKQESNDFMKPEDRLKALQQELDGLRKQIENEEFEKGKWYKLIGGNALAKYTSPKNGIGFGARGEWCENVLMTFRNQWREATKNEIKQALDKERKRRGIEREQIVKTPCNKFEYKIDGFEINYKKETDRLFYGGILVYEQGNWAEPVQQNKIYDYTVEHKGGKFYKIGCEESLERSFLEQLVTLTKKHEIKIELEGHDVTNDIKTLEL